MTRTAASHLIIAGVTRAASTSLFGYLADHPRIRRATIKETRFFLGDDPHLPRLASHDQGIEQYAQFFPNCPEDAVRLEATPDYLYDADVAERIAAALPRPRVVVLVREPVARLISWYRFAQQNGRLDAAMSFDAYVRQQRDLDADDRAATPQPMRALAQGRYADYLPPWLERFGGDDLLVLSQGELKRDAAGVLKRICALAGVDGSFYDTYTFRATNQSRAVRNPTVERAYRRLIWSLKPWVHDRPALRAPLRVARRTVQPVLHRLNRRRGDDGEVRMADATRAFLDGYYAQQPARLAQLTGREPWVW